jgi:YggT family protein
MFFLYLYAAVRSVVLLALIYAAAVALTHWAVRARRIDPFGRWARLIRQVSDPVVVPLERMVIRAGASPQNAPYWLLGIVIGGGLLLLTLTQWLIGTATTMVYLSHGGPRVWIRVLVSALFTVVMTAILIRVIASWFGIGPYRSWMRPLVALTSWIIEPIRRVLPAFGPFDFSPMVAWLVLYVVRAFVLGLL